ncbi:mCG146924 [Mus musculus]|nr:mCG146924 [Mus musculus]
MSPSRLKRASETLRQPRSLLEIQNINSMYSGNNLQNIGR